MSSSIELKAFNFSSASCIASLSESERPLPLSSQYSSFTVTDKYSMCMGEEGLARSFSSHEMDSSLIWVELHCVCRVRLAVGTLVPPTPRLSELDFSIEMVDVVASHESGSCSIHVWLVRTAAFTGEFEILHSEDQWTSGLGV